MKRKQPFEPYQTIRRRETRQTVGTTRAKLFRIRA